MDLVMKTVLVKAGVALVTGFLTTALTKAATDAFLTDTPELESENDPSDPSTEK